MNLKRIFEHYKEDMNYEILWDIVLVDRTTGEKAIVKEESDRYWGADPFLFSHDGTTYLFYEQYDRNLKKGRIAYRIIEKDLSYSPAQVAFEESFHMSFPFIFQYGGNIYVVPETSAINEIRLYKALDFPKKWAFEKIIAPAFSAVDTIVYHMDNDGIDFYTSVGDSCNVENYIVKCDNLFRCKSKYVVKKISAEGNRNAGGLIFQNGNVFRVGQDCTGNTYGKSVIVYKCTTDDFNEEETKRITYDDFADLNKRYCGIHTYNTLDDIDVVDLKYVIKKPLRKKIAFIAEKAFGLLKRKIRKGD